MSGDNDVEKRWHDSRGFRAAAWYTIAVITSAIAVLVGCIVWASANPDQCVDAAFIVCENPELNILLLAPPSLLLIGGLGAFVQTYRVWRRKGAWPIWQGAGWALLTFMVLYMGMSLSIVRR